MENFDVGSVIQKVMRAFTRKALPGNYRQSLYYIHPDEKLFIYDFRHDLTAVGLGACPQAGDGQFIIMDWVVPKSQVWIIKGFAPYAMERTNVGGVTESARFIQPQDGNGWFSYAPLTATGAPFVIQSNYNAPQNDTGAQTDRARQVSNGITQISLNPVSDAVEQMRNPFFSMPVFSENPFQTIFALTGPAATGVPISNPYAIGNPVAPDDRRVDFAGVVVAGVMMSETAYRDAAQLFKPEE